MLYSCPYNEKENDLEENPVGDNYFCLTFFLFDPSALYGWYHPCCHICSSTFCNKKY